jgi:hypothetical protein
MNFPDNILEQTDHFVNGLEITSHTLIGVNTRKYPVSHGNCFSMSSDNGKVYKIVNFYLENLEEGIERGKLTLPVRLYILGDSDKSRIAIIYDSRIPSDWYANEFCTTCTPLKFQSFTQRMRRELKVESGILTIAKYENYEITRETIGDGKTDWRTDKEKEPIVYANYRPQFSEPIVFMGADVNDSILAALVEEANKEKQGE